ncbi:hypothetical protein J7T55_009445 [Diaporthe amygdali]|uniref:uncharacterized protein n=1 Tax=Phomopsis amygdali TaxID=1214568 RepID=UPI0022FDCE16|nr:uncharacterized protein J7T55_009445 [Diaporthe amygdali]KAJ0104281.1 hypothetical protein J7T55_009445 [Diaporthe amygdali]
MKPSLSLALVALGAALSDARCIRKSTTSTAAVSKMAASTSAESSQADAQTKAPLATWIWNTTLITDASQMTYFFTFAKGQGLQRAYLHVDADIDNSYFESFIQQCNTSGIVVEALMGNAEWILGGGTPSLQSNLDWIAQYQGNASASARFSGIHMDIELWSLSDWQSMLGTYIPAWESIVTYVSSFARSLGITTAADLPFWTYTMSDPTTGEAMDSWMLNALDSVTFMTYRNTVNELFQVAEKPLTAADAAGKPVYVAVETVASTEASVSFKGLATVTSLSTSLQNITMECSNHTSFAGVAVHDYAGWVALG